MTSQVVADLHERLIDQMPEAVILADHEGRIQLWNCGAERLFGHGAADVVGASLDIIIPEELRARHWEGYHRAMRAGQTRLGPRALPTKAVRKSGETIYVELSFAIIRSEAGTPLGALAVGRDITERYRQERGRRQRLAELEERLRSAPAGGGTAPD